MSHPEQNLLAARDKKIKSHHQERLAVVYVRQSSVHQVQHHQESTQLQYGLVAQAERLGWPTERILVIDDDLGFSGSSSEKRLGFQRLLSEVALGHVGVILGVEMSRLARSCKDWYQLLELCALFDTLISDLDGLYDPSSYNDRLLLGLKGTMSEAELHVLRQRMWQGALQKARRGELLSKGPVGYVRSADELVFDPDEQAQGVVRTIFDQFERLGTMHAVLRHLVAEGIRMPVRPSSGPNKGQLEWRRPNQAAIQNMLTHPVYAGAYVFGRSCQSQKRKQQKRPSRLSQNEWLVLLRDRFPAYISWSQYEENQERLEQNRSIISSRGSVRQGRALLAGMLVCGRCGYRLRTQYGGSNSRPSYQCSARSSLYADPVCQRLKAQPLDDEVVRLAMLALQPSALAVSCQVASDFHEQREASQTLWSQKLERATYEAERAARQYHAVEPENRLVARTLELAWEEKLRSQRELEEQYERFLQEQPKSLSNEDQERIKGLAANVPALWTAASTTDVDRKEILREIIDHVVIDVEGKSEWVEARIHWAGGHQTYTRFRRPVGQLSKLSTGTQLMQYLKELLDSKISAPQIANKLNEEGFLTPRGLPFNESRVRMLMLRYGLRTCKKSSYQNTSPLDENEWYISEITQKLQVKYGKIHQWIKDGKINARKADDGRWIITADEAKCRELTAPPSPRRFPGPKTKNTKGENKT